MCLPEGNAPAHRTLVSADHLSDSSAAEATMILKVEPGGYWPCRARFVSGCRVSDAICSHSAGVSPRDRTLGAEAGLLAITSTSLVLGSSATIPAGAGPNSDSERRARRTVRLR